MGLFWDLMQESKISRQESRSGVLEQRIADLETELDRTRTLLAAVIERLEKHFNVDLNQDGRIG